MATIIDAETVAIDGVGAFYPEPPQANKTLKDPEKIAADIAAKSAARIADAALYPWTARIIALGWCGQGDETVTVRTCLTELSEADALREFWGRTVDPSTDFVDPLVTFNGLKFDLPLLLARSRLLGVRAPQMNLDRYRSPHPDLLQILTFHGAIDMRSLLFFARRFGLNTDDAFSGAEVAQLYESRNWDAIRKHVESDVTLTRQLAERMGVIRPLVRVR